MHGQFGMIQTRDSCPGDDAFIEMVYLQCCLVVTLLAPCETAAILAHIMCTPYSHAPVYSVTSVQANRPDITAPVLLGIKHQLTYLQSKPYMLGACVFKCHLHFWQNDQNHLHAMLYHWGGTDTEIRVNNES